MQSRGCPGILLSFDMPFQFVLSNGSQHCFPFHQLPLTWKKAGKSCMITELRTGTEPAPRCSNRVELKVLVVLKYRQVLACRKQQSNKQGQDTNRHMVSITEKAEIS